MPLFIDTHKNVDGLTADAATRAHAMDLATQEKHGVRYLLLVQRRLRPHLLPGGRAVSRGRQAGTQRSARA
jgi:hypothetical protein